MTRSVTPAAEPSPAATLRLDKWLWHARFFKTRTRAAAFSSEGRLRLNGRHVEKASASVRVGDVLTFALGERVHVVRVAALGARRGPPAEARTLYVDMTVRDANVGLGLRSEPELPS